MEFLTRFFDDESQIIGLCRFKSIQPKNNKRTEEQDVFFNPFQNEMKLALNYETNFVKNVLL